MTTRFIFLEYITGGKNYVNNSLSWLKDYVDIDVTPKELEEKLFSCGFEVEESYEVGKDISNVVVGLVEKCEPIPETHLSLCQVNAEHMAHSRSAVERTM